MNYTSFTLHIKITDPHHTLGTTVNRHKRIRFWVSLIYCLTQAKFVWCMSSHTNVICQSPSVFSMKYAFGQTHQLIHSHWLRMKSRFHKSDQSSDKSLMNGMSTSVTGIEVLIIPFIISAYHRYILCVFDFSLFVWGFIFCFLLKPNC